jgi:hypothetical protein
MIHLRVLAVGAVAIIGAHPVQEMPDGTPGGVQGKAPGVVQGKRAAAKPAIKRAIKRARKLATRPGIDQRQPKTAVVIQHRSQLAIKVVDVVSSERPYRYVVGSGLVADTKP